MRVYKVVTTSIHRPKLHMHHYCENTEERGRRHGLDREADCTCRPQAGWPGRRAIWSTFQGEPGQLCQQLNTVTRRMHKGGGAILLAAKC